MEIRISLLLCVTFSSFLGAEAIGDATCRLARCVGGDLCQQKGQGQELHDFVKPGNACPHLVYFADKCVTL